MFVEVRREWSARGEVRRPVAGAALVFMVWRRPKVTVGDPSRHQASPLGSLPVVAPVPPIHGWDAPEATPSWQ
ncbi:hypothetical protein AB0J84_17770 [Micromonospora arborensis]|uniref:hypothetical protein n=1 Tax=Micromonospora arborensis TaxID=2116518 RepID=UPI00341748D6